jgi:hypothetical protein
MRWGCGDEEEKKAQKLQFTLICRPNRSTNRDELCTSPDIKMIIMCAKFGFHHSRGFQSVDP